MRIGYALLILAALSTFATVTSAEDRPDHARCAVPLLRDIVGEDIWSEAGENVRSLPCDHTPVGPPPNPGIGDSWDWYIWRLNGYPQADLRSCTVRGMGPNCYVVVEDSQWNLNINQAQVDTIVAHFEDRSIGEFSDMGIWDLNRLHFGDPPNNIDKDPRVYILYYDFDVSSDGFFWIFDQQCDDVAQFHSNETDVVYMNCSDYDPAGAYLLAVLAHEFEHLIHENYDSNEVSWVDEGLAELAMWLYGNPDNISAFNSNPDRQLTMFDGVWADYIKTYLWTLYFYERYGGQPAIRALVEEPLNSISGYEAVLDDLGYSESFADVFSDWVVANYLDDTSIYDGRYGYLGDDLPPFNPFVTSSSYPVGPNMTLVSYWAADYARYLNGTDLTMTFDGSDNNSFAVRALLIDDLNDTEVVDMTLDAAEDGMLNLPQVGDTHEEAVMVYASISSIGTRTYTYGATQGAVGVPAEGGPSALALTALGAAVRPTLRWGVPSDADGESIRLELFDLSGRSVHTIADLPVRAGWHEFTWDGRSDAGDVLASGRFFARLTLGDTHAVTPVTLLR